MLMWRLFLLFVMLIYGVRLCYGQQFTDDLQTMMTYLPRTADDFHSKYYDTDLESAMSVSSFSLYYNTIEGIPIMKHDGSINSLTVQFYETIEDTPIIELKMKFDSNGILSSCKGSGIRRILYGPNLALEDNKTFEYTRDSKNRVTEAKVQKYNQTFLVFRYSYMPNSKKIATVKGYNSDGEILGEVLYSYNSGRLSGLHFKGYIYTSKGACLTAESKKTYIYDGHGNLSKTELSKWHGSKSAGYRQVFTFDNQYNDRGLLVLSKTSFSQSYNSGRRGGTPVYSTIKYTYDNHDNWIKVESDKRKKIIRQFGYN